MKKDSAEKKKIPLGISSCLLGERVRFDGGHKQNRYIMDTLGQYFSFQQFCPEVEIGMGVPRQTIRLVTSEAGVEAVGVKDQTLNVTEKLRDIAEAQRGWHQHIFGYILKKDSPSCGMERVRLYRNDQPQRIGVGLYAEVLMKNFPHLPVEEEGRLGDALLRENFVQRVFIYHRWHEMVENGLNWSGLTDFHARHKLILMSHDQDRARALGRELSNAHRQPVEEYAESYLAELMQILKIVATRQNHVNVLEHIRGYLKRDLDRDDKRELSDSIEKYRLGLLPLIVPITLLRHHFRKNPSDYIERSYSMQPHPDELMLLNAL